MYVSDLKINPRVLLSHSKTAIVCRFNYLLQQEKNEMMVMVTEEWISGIQHGNMNDLKGSYNRRLIGQLFVDVSISASPRCLQK